MKLLLQIALFLLLSSAAFAQQSVVITLSVPAASAQLLTAWMGTFCVENSPTTGLCITKKYPNLKTMLRDQIADLMEANTKAATTWAQEVKDASIPAAIAPLVVNKNTATQNLETAIKNTTPGVTVQ